MKTKSCVYILKLTTDRALCTGFLPSPPLETVQSIEVPMFPRPFQRYTVSGVRSSKAPYKITEHILMDHGLKSEAN